MDLRWITLLMLTAGLAGCADDAPEMDDETVDDIEETTALVLLSDGHFEGMLPDLAAPPETVSHNHTFDVPANSTKLTWWFNNTYTGVFHSVLTVFDAEGTEVWDSISCTDIAPVVQGPASCEASLRNAAAGNWNFQVVWQVGEVAETYSIDTYAFGRA